MVINTQNGEWRSFPAQTYNNNERQPLLPLIAEDRTISEPSDVDTNITSARGDGDERTLDENEEDEEDEGPPSLTAAFSSMENRPILKLCAMYMAIYLGVAVIAFSFVFEKWTIIDSLYFAVSTFTTCGYGDKEPTTIAGQLFTIVFAIYGVIILGVFIGIVGNFLSEHQREATLTSQEEYGDQVLESLFAGIEEETMANKNGSQTTHTNHRHRYTYKEARDDFLGDQISLADDIWFVVRNEAKPIGLVALGGLILGIREGWDLTSILYFCIMAASTTGYGDYTPVYQADKVGSNEGQCRGKHCRRCYDSDSHSIYVGLLHILLSLCCLCLW